MAITDLFHSLWQQYLQVTPSALPIQQLLGQGQMVINDHIALRTFDLPDIGVEDLGNHFQNLGFCWQDEYYFEVKKLRARYLKHPDPQVPKVFISELQVGELSSMAQRIIGQLYQQLPNSFMRESQDLYAGALWQVSYKDYQQLLSESEYAAWLAAFGYRANHFTVSVNDLEGVSDLQQINATLLDAGYQLNRSGGTIKGSPQAMLEQSATLADHVQVAFSDQSVLIPSCFYEFALRYCDGHGQLYQGFVPTSADQIFDSTNHRLASQ